MPEDDNPNQLVVEGYEDQYSVYGLMRAHTPWPAGVKNAPVFIRRGLSAEEILRPDFLSVLLKAPTIKRLGIVIDADSSVIGRYQRIHTVSAVFFPDMPATLPSQGLVTQDLNGRRLGVWIMPDNVSEGALETFLRPLVPEDALPPWAHAERSTVEARRLGARFRDTHTEKAHMYAWLAWQDPPSQDRGRALFNRSLDPHAPSARPFVNWFKRLYELPDL